jgi:Delta24-sterol reductase
MRHVFPSIYGPRSHSGVIFAPYFASNLWAIGWVPLPVRSFSNMDMHSKKVEQLQESVRVFRNSSILSCPLALDYRSGPSNTTRSKSYKHACTSLDFSKFNDVIQIDPEKQIAIVEPRVTMEALLKATLAYQLMPAVIPECKGITVGGAIMGGAAESSSHRWGCFNDICSSYQLICGDGTLVRASRDENQDIFYGVAGSYGSLGALVAAEIQLIPAPRFVHLCYSVYPHPLEAIENIQNMLKKTPKPDFIDVIIFQKNLAVIIEGHLESKNDVSTEASSFSLKSPFSQWFYQHVKQIAVDTRKSMHKERMTLENYVFRYDLGAFWMGTYLFRIPFLRHFVSEGLLGFEKPIKENFYERDIQSLHKVRDPPFLKRALMRPLLNSQNLWALLHRAEKWVKNRMMIQDFCIPERHAQNFCCEILNNPAIYPIWVCPIKGTRTPQIFAPHLLSQDSTDRYLINFGLYGIPAYDHPICHITRKLEQDACVYGGRKALYSHSYYSLDEFWKIYSRQIYENLRKKTHAQGMWHDITDKVLSE